MGLIRMREQLLKKYVVLIARSGQAPLNLSFTPLTISLLTLILTGMLGSLVFGLCHRNHRLTQENRQLTDKAHEVLTELDSLDSEIENLRERAGLSEGDTPVNEDGDPVDPRLPPRGGGPGGPNPLKPDPLKPDPLRLFAIAEQRMPFLNARLDGNVKPALEKTLAAEAKAAAAFPDGQPLTIDLQITSEFGVRPNPFGGRAYEKHEGIDFMGPYGTPVLATAKGTVKRASYHGGFGQSVVIDHGYGYETLYGHLSKLAVQSGVSVSRGQVVGYLGSTGRSSGPHLHYGIYRQGKAVNPRPYLPITAPKAVIDNWQLR